MIKVRVPATTANIGPGFDSLGLAFKFYSYFSFEEIEEGLEITGCPMEYRNKKNLVYTSFAKTMEILNFKIKGLRIHIDTLVPPSRGLGSSATCIVGGVMGANLIAGSPLTRQEVFKICNDIEGHPDNIAPAIFGGLTASLVEKEVPYTIRYNISKELCFYGMIPNFKVSTEKARKVLPKEISYHDAVFNVSRVAVLLKAFEEGNEELIKLSLEDKLHEPYRSSLIYEYSQVKEINKTNKALGFFISGSGPTLISISKDEEFQEKIEPSIKNLKNSWIIKKLEVDTEGVKTIG